MSQTLLFMLESCSNNIINKYGHPDFIRNMLRIKFYRWYNIIKSIKESLFLLKLDRYNKQRNGFKYTLNKIFIYLSSSSLSFLSYDNRNMGNRIFKYLYGHNFCLLWSNSTNSPFKVILMTMTILILMANNFFSKCLVITRSVLKKKHLKK